MREPLSAGVAFKPFHFEEALACRAQGLWFEVHAENYMADGGPRLAMLKALRSHAPVSLHGVGLSLAGGDDPDPMHLARLRALADLIDPCLVSEHLAWSTWAGVYHPDLLPFPRTQQALERITRNIDIAQNALGRRLLLENPSLYLDLAGHEFSEPDFLACLVGRTGCGLLIDVNNVFVSAHNLGFSPEDYLDALPAEAICEIHLAGHTPDPQLGEALLIDTHAAPVCVSVWSLFGRLIDRVGPKPTLIERDDDIPPFDVLLGERDRAARHLERAVAGRETLADA